VNLLGHFVSFGQVEPGPVAHRVTLDRVSGTSDTHLTHPPVWASAAPSGVKIIKKKGFYESLSASGRFCCYKMFPFQWKMCFMFSFKQFNLVVLQEWLAVYLNLLAYC
jgi:hypothetical protein